MNFPVKNGSHPQKYFCFLISMKVENQHQVLTMGNNRFNLGYIRNSSFTSNWLRSCHALLVLFFFLSGFCTNTDAAIHTFLGSGNRTEKNGWVGRITPVAGDEAIIKNSEMIAVNVHSITSSFTNITYTQRMLLGLGLYGNSYTQHDKLYFNYA